MPVQHHAFLYYGHDLSVVPDAVQVPSADVRHFLVAAWKISDSRQLASAAAVRPVAGTTQQFVILANTLTIEAQNALLKLFEDPPPDTVFHIVVPGQDRLLPTVRSRLQLSGPKQKGTTVEAAAWESLATDLVAAQLATIAARAKAKDTAWMDAVLRAAINDDRVPIATRQLLDQFARDRGASRKWLLEELVLSQH